MGHSVGLDNSYFRPSIEKMQLEYMKAVNDLTINEDFRLKEQLVRLKLEQKEIQTIKSDHDKEIKIVNDRFTSLEREVHKFISEFLKTDQRTLNKFAKRGLKSGIYKKIS